jgi:hypothetical protein
MRIGLPIELDRLAPQSAVLFAIKHVPGFTGCVLVFMCTVFHLFGYWAVTSECYKAGYKGDICEFLASFPILTKSRLFAIWACSKVFMGAHIAAAWVYTTVIKLGLYAWQVGNTRTNFVDLW